MPTTPTPIPKMNSKSLVAASRWPPAINAYARVLFPVLQPVTPQGRDRYEIVQRREAAGGIVQQTKIGNAVFIHSDDVLEQIQLLVRAAPPLFEDSLRLIRRRNPIPH
jgi:hypothetical protein